MAGFRLWNLQGHCDLRNYSVFLHLWTEPPDVTLPSDSPFSSFAVEGNKGINESNAEILPSVQVFLMNLLGEFRHVVFLLCARESSRIVCEVRILHLSLAWVLMPWTLSSPPEGTQSQADWEYTFLVCS